MMHPEKVQKLAPRSSTACRRGGVSVKDVLPDTTPALQLEWRQLNLIFTIVQKSLN
jgi:hypothetical protein